MTAPRVVGDAVGEHGQRVVLDRDRGGRAPRRTTPRRSATAAAAAAVDGAATSAASGRVRRSQRRHWASACGWVPTPRTAARVVPGRASSANETGSATSRVTMSGSPVASSSRVAVTAPSTEFSIGTIAAVTSPRRTPSSADGTVGYGCRSALGGRRQGAQRRLGERALGPEVAEARRARARSARHRSRRRGHAAGSARVEVSGPRHARGGLEGEADGLLLLGRERLVAAPAPQRPWRRCGCRCAR